MTFNISIGSTLIASSTNDGIPYLWKSGDITTSPSNETKITASDGTDNDEFGISVAVGSSRIVVGAHQVNHANHVGSFSGSAYIFDLNGNQLGIITASDGDAYDRFGQSVAVGSGRIVVGAYSNDIGSNNAQGSAYIFDLDGNEVSIITASDGAASDEFGRSVAVGSGRIVVGADNDDDDGSGSGSAYIFDLDGNQLAKITASDAAAGDQFGFSVAVGSGRIVVGANGDDNNGTLSGSAYIFDLDGNEVGIITASDGGLNDRFGQSVAVGSGRIVVGALFASYAGSAEGRAYIFDLDGNQLGIISASDGATADYFGTSVAVGSGRIVVSASQHHVGSNADQGAAYIFDLDGNQLGIITASDGAADDQFGGGRHDTQGVQAVAVGCGRIVVGANQDDVGTNLAQGSAYIYETPQIYTLYDAIELQSVGITTL